YVTHISGKAVLPPLKFNNTVLVSENEKADVIRLNKTTRTQYPMYRLFVYGEGYYADELRYSKRHTWAEVSFLMNAA
uniref:Uncharacterized protein n=1 Tax=Romanomermis culicivorax TaxID=13658 RepID=A0A915I7V6_ROMCU